MIIFSLFTGIALGVGITLMATGKQQIGNYKNDKL
jgi:hypothetical protein